jgi:type IV pilus assembly protein PilA
VELIVVIAIMAVLVGVLAPQFIKYVEKSRISTDIQNLDQIKTAVETYIVENPVTEGISAFENDVKTSDGTDQEVKNDTIKAALEDAGLDTTIKFKSKKWDNVNITVSAEGKVTVSGEATYNKVTYKADGTSSADTTGDNNNGGGEG